LHFDVDDRMIDDDYDENDDYDDVGHQREYVG